MLLTAGAGRAGGTSAEWPGLSVEEQGQCHSRTPPETWLDRGKITSLQTWSAEYLPQLMKQWLICKKSHILTFLALQRFQ